MLLPRANYACESSTATAMHSALISLRVPAVRIAEFHHESSFIIESVSGKRFVNVLRRREGPLRRFCPSYIGCLALTCVSSPSDRVRRQYPSWLAGQDSVLPSFVRLLGYRNSTLTLPTPQPSCARICWCLLCSQLLKKSDSFADPCGQTLDRDGIDVRTILIGRACKRHVCRRVSAAGGRDERGWLGRDALRRRAGVNAHAR
eukprot:3184535-Pleurochrysis_carterae.AAC.2